MDTSGMTSSIQLRPWQPCSSRAFYTPPAQAFNSSHPWPKGTFAITAAHTKHPEQPLSCWDPLSPHLQTCQGCWSLAGQSQSPGNAGNSLVATRTSWGQRSTWYGGHVPCQGTEWDGQ